MATAPINGTIQAPFEGEARNALLGIQTALADVLNALPDRPLNPNELRHALGIDKNLAWKVSKAVEERDPLAVATFLPGEAGQEILLRAATRSGAPAKAIEAVRSAREVVDRIITQHAGDRATFELMLVGHRDMCQNRAAVAQRREAFRSNSLVWGVQAKVQYKASFLNPSAHPGMVDVARIRGFIDLRRLRPDAPWTIARVRVVDDQGTETSPSPSLELLDKETESRGIPLLAEFCTKPLPQFRMRHDPNGITREELVDAPVGNAGAITCIAGDICRNAGPMVRDAENTYLASVGRLHTPCEVLLFDLFVHRDILRGATPEFAIYGELDAPPWPACGERERLPLSAPVEDRGSGAFAARTRDVPRCSDMARYVFERTGWPEMEFNLFRVRLEYPPLPVSAVMRYELPEKT